MDKLPTSYEAFESGQFEQEIVVLTSGKQSAIGYNSPNGSDRNDDGFGGEVIVDAGTVISGCLQPDPDDLEVKRFHLLIRS